MPFEVTTDVPYGNAADMHVTEENGKAVVRFTAAPFGGPEALWFCLRIVRKGEAPAELTLIHTNFRNTLGGGMPERLRPVVRYEGKDWERLCPGRSIRHEDGRQDAAWDIPAPETFADIAVCYPYGVPEVKQLVADTEGYYRLDSIGVSSMGRPLLRLWNDGGDRTEGKRKGVYLISRQHSAESSGSWVLDGVLRRLAKAGNEAPLTWCVPLANIDGVEEGHYGKDHFPYDLNRAWEAPSMRHEVLVFMRDLAEWKRRCIPLVGMDFHAPGECESSGVYVFVPDHEREPERSADSLPWAEACREAVGEYADDDFCKVARYKSRWETPGFQKFMYDDTGVPGLTFETPYSIIGDTPLTRETYRDIGTRIAQAILSMM